MRILLIGTDFFQYTEVLNEAMKELGHDVHVHILKDDWSHTFLGKAYNKLWNMYKRIIKKPDEIYCCPAFLQERLSQQVLEFYKKMKPDAVIVFAAYILNEKVISEMNNCQKVLWIFDSIRNLSGIYPTLPYYDKIYTFEKTDIDYFDKLGYKAEFLPLCADKEHYYLQKQNKDIDIFFVGHLTKSRVKFFRELRRTFPDVKMRIYGKYVGKYDWLGMMCRKINHEEEYLMNQFLKPQEINELYSRSKICLNIHHNQTKNGANMRVFETLATGAFQLVDENEYIVEKFKDGLVTYKDNDDLIEKIKYYLEHEEEREAISKRGYEKVMREDLFIHRAQYILSNLQ